MFSMRLEYFVSYLKDTLLGDDIAPIKHEYKDGNSHVTKNGLLIRLDLSMRNHSEGLGHRALAYVLLAGNCNVFVMLAPFGSYFQDLEINQFKNISNHDSCWRNAIGNWLNEIYFQWADDIRGDKAPKDVYSECHPVFFKHVPIELTYCPSNLDNYRNELVDVVIKSEGLV